MGRKYKFHDSRDLYFVSFATVNWTDIFVREKYFKIMVDSMHFCIVNKGLGLYAWCIMPSHVHLIISSESASLPDIMRDLKKFTSKALIAEIEMNQKESRQKWLLWMFKRAGMRNNKNSKYQFWQQNNHPVLLSTQTMLSQRLKYLHNNPVKAGFVTETHFWKYSSAIDYVGGKGLLPIIFIDGA